MNGRQRAGLVLAAVLLALMAVWAACTAHNAKELAQALETAQRAAETATEQAETLREENAALLRTVEQLRAEVEETTLRDKLRSLPRMENCVVSHYCCEKRAHICGTGNGITASGAPVQAEVSVAVDPGIIPLGSRVYVDYGDGEIYEYIAHDTGAWVNGGHIDVAVATHEEALKRGIKRATVWWEEAE